MADENPPAVMIPKELLRQIVRSLCSVPDLVSIKESRRSNPKGGADTVFLSIICNKKDAPFVVGDNGGDDRDRPGAVLRGIRAIFRNIGRYENCLFVIDLDESVKKFRPQKSENGFTVSEMIAVLTLTSFWGIVLFAAVHFIRKLW